MLPENTQALIVYGPDEKQQSALIDHLLEDKKIRFVHRFGGEKPLGIDDVHEIRRRASLAPGGGESQVFILSRADEMTHEASQALLKILEEPPSSTLFFLKARLLNFPETILSRVSQRWCHGSGDSPEDFMFGEDIIILKSKLEKEIRRTKTVSVGPLASLERSLDYSMLAERPRISARAVEEIYDILKNIP